MGSAGESTKVLQCGVVGAGIAGLGAAIALRRAGHDVQVYEKSAFKNEIGAAITMSPNANLILERWGFNMKNARETTKCQYRRLDSATLECAVQRDFSDVKEQWGHAFNAFHRVDMHEELRRLAGALDVDIDLGKEAVDVDCARGVLKFGDGSEVQKHLVILADGIKSRFVEAVTGDDIPTKKTGISVDRGLIPIDRLMADPLVRPMLEGQPSGFCSTVNFETKCIIVTYPCREDTIMNVAIFHVRTMTREPSQISETYADPPTHRDQPTRPHQEQNDSWHSTTDIREVAEMVGGAFNPAWAALVKHADKMNTYTAGNRDCLPRMTNGKVALIGDAAHPMMPIYAQGGCVSVEDAAALEVLFGHWTADDSVERRLELFNQLRLPRDSVTQLLSNAVFHARDIPGYVERRIRDFYSGPYIGPAEESWSPPIQRFFFGYDTFAEAEKAMKYKDDPAAMPEGAICHFGDPGTDVLPTKTKWQNAQNIQWPIDERAGGGHV